MERNMEFLSTGGTLEEGSEFDGYSPSELAATVKALWARQEERPIPEDIPWSEFDPEKVMLRFRDELNRLQPRIEALYADRGTGRVFIFCPSRTGCATSTRIPGRTGLNRGLHATTGLRNRRCTCLRSVHGAIRRASIASRPPLRKPCAPRASRGTFPARSFFVFPSGRSMLRCRR